jgi:hypothetical protein
MKQKNFLKIFLFLLWTTFSYNINGQIISQYIETTSGATPKGIEIWNNTAETLDFSVNNLVIEKGANGSSPSVYYTLSSGTLAARAVIVIGTSDLQTTTESNGATFYLKAFDFNGDDALVVKSGATTTDVFGEPGSDPGTSWNGDGVSTANNNISLKDGITTGDTDGWTDPSIRFETTANGTTDTGFGIAPPPPPTVGFDAATSTETETQTTFTSATIPITVSNYSDTQIDIDVTATLGTAEAEDFDFTSPTALSFTANGSQTITLDINDDDDADDETIIITITETSAVTGLVISQATHTVTVTDDDTNWDGSEDGLWETAANWTNGLPGATNNVTIVNVGTAPIIGTDISAVVKNMTIAHAGGLTINAGNLTIEGNLTIADGSNLTSNSVFTGLKTIDAATVILKGTYTSASANQFIYNTETFNDDTSGWTLVSSPAVGEVINGDDGFALFNKLQKNTSGDGTKFGIAPYDNSEGDPEERWKYYTNNDFTVANFPGGQDISMENGKGYSVLPSTAGGNQTKGKLRFKGAIAAGNVQIAITNNTAGDPNDESTLNPFVGNAYNLIGNPYPSFISGNIFLDAVSTQLSQQTIWFWDKATDVYIAVNNTSNRFISPAQGFFVESKAAGGNVTFTDAMQSHQASAVFNKKENVRPEIQLNISNNGISKNTAIYYYDNKTSGFDSGYDSSMFGGVPSSLAVYTKLVATDDKRNLAIQTLPTSNYETMVIPVGVKAAENSEVTFSASAINLPEGINLYIEDRVNNTVTRLDTANPEYKTTVIKNTTEGRFYLHTKTEAVLNTQTAILNTVSFFKTSNNNLKIKGLQKGETTISLFNILGKNVMNTSFEASSVKNIALPNLASGIYIVKLQTKEGSLNKKIILE